MPGFDDYLLHHGNEYYPEGSDPTPEAVEASFQRALKGYQRQLEAEKANSESEVYSESKVYSIPHNANDFAEDVHDYLNDDEGVPNREVFENYSPKHTDVMDSMRFMDVKAKRAIFETAMKKSNFPAYVAAKKAGLTSERWQREVLYFIAQKMPEKKAELDELTRKINYYNDSDDKTKEDLNELTDTFNDLLNDAKKHLEEKAPEYEKQFAKEMTNEELIEKWSDIEPVLACYFEAQDLHSKDDDMLPSDKISFLSKTDSMMNTARLLKTHMSILSNPNAPYIDREELLPIGDLLSSFSGKYKDDQESMKIINDYWADSKTVFNRYLSGAIKHFSLSPKEESLILQDKEGNIFSGDDVEKVFDMLFVKQETLYAVPEDDPMAEPAIIQPINKNGLAAINNDLADLTFEPIPPVEKPYGITMFFNSVFSGIAGLFNKDFQFDSCRKYNEYCRKVETVDSQKAKIENSKNEYSTISGKDNLKNVGEKFISHSMDKYNVTREMLEKQHENFPNRFEQKNIEHVKNVKKKNDLALIKSRINTLKAELPNVDDKLYNDFSTQLRAVASKNDQIRANICQSIKDDNLSDLYREYKEQKAQNSAQSLENILKTRQKNIGENQINNEGPSLNAN